MSMSRRLKRIEDRSAGNGMSILWADEDEKEGGRMVARTSLGGTWRYKRVQREDEEEEDFLNEVREDLALEQPGKKFIELIRCKNL